MTNPDSYRDSLTSLSHIHTLYIIHRHISAVYLAELIIEKNISNFNYQKQMLWSSQEKNSSKTF
jgi:hypothetical protein